MGGSAVERSALDQMSRRQVTHRFNHSRQLQKHSTADHRVAAVDKLFTLLALRGVVAVARMVWQPILSPTVNLDWLCVHDRHRLIRVELCRFSSFVKLVRLSVVVNKGNFTFYIK